MILFNSVSPGIAHNGSFLFQVEQAGLTRKSIRLVEFLVFDDKVHGFKRFCFFFGREPDDDVTMHGDAKLHTIVRDPPNPFLLDSFFHEIHDALIEGFQSEDDFQTPRILH